MNRREFTQAALVGLGIATVFQTTIDHDDMLIPPRTINQPSLVETSQDDMTYSLMKLVDYRDQEEPWEQASRETFVFKLLTVGMV